MKTKPKKRAPSQDVTCELCKSVVKARGLKTHLRNIHKSSLEETKEVQSVSVQNTTDGSTVVIEQVAIKRYYHHYERCHFCKKGHDDSRMLIVKRQLVCVCPNCEATRLK